MKVGDDADPRSRAGGGDIARLVTRQFDRPGIGLAIQLAPVFTGWALWGVPGHKRLAIFSWVWGAGLLVMLMLLTGVWNVRTGYDVGLWQRSHALLGLTWLAIAAYALARGRRGDHPRDFA